MAMVEKRLEKSTNLRYSSTISIHGKTDESNEEELIQKSRSRFEHKQSHLNTDIVEGGTANCFMETSLKINKCKYCSYKMEYFRANG